MKRARAIDKVLRSYPFRYTLHLPDELSLSRAETAEMEKKIFGACIDFAEFVGA